MKFSRYPVLFCLGFLSVAFQTLIFREFMGSFESSDIAVGIFFSSWLLWIFLSSLAFLKLKSRLIRLAGKFETLLLLFIPAFAIQLFLVVAVRSIAGMESYELVSLQKMILWSAIVNIPVSLVSGLLFPLACEWISGLEVPVARVYALEASGFFAGGVVVTLLLSAGCGSILIFFLCSLAAVCACANAKFADGGSKAVFALPAAVLLCIVLRADRPLADAVREFKWSRLLPADSYQGAFQTPQAEYLYGTYGGQWTVIREGAVCEAIPQPEDAGRIAATVFAQNPEARNVLVIGSGIELCRTMLLFPQLSGLVWAAQDREYMVQVEKFMPEKLRISDPRFRALEKDPVEFIRNSKGNLDLIVVNVGSTGNSFANRYFTGDFYALARSALKRNGTIAVRIQSGENVISPEEAFTGASVLETLGKIFQEIIVVPGEDCWFIASESRKLSGSPRDAIRNFSSMAGSSNVFPAEVLKDIYRPERAEFAAGSFKSTGIAGRFLVNTEARPSVFLAGLMLSLRQAGTNVTEFMKSLLVAGPAIFAAPFIVLLILRLISMGKMPGFARAPSIEGKFLVFSSGAASMGTVIVLSYLYQSRFGSLFLNMGLISAAFMAGLAAGAILASRIIVRLQVRGISSTVLLILLAHIFLLAAIFSFGTYFSTEFSFAVLFALNGFLNGPYLPCSSKILSESGYGTPETGAVMESADSLGAVGGALFTGVLLVPVAGTDGAIIVFAVIVLVNIPMIYFSCFPERRGQRIAVTAAAILAALLMLLSAGNAFYPRTSEPEISAAESEVRDSGLASEKSPELEMAEREEESSSLNPPPPGNSKFDVEDVKKKIEEGKLSGREAEFYEKE